MENHEREFPFGSILGVDGKYLVFSDGEKWDLNEMFGQHFCTNQPPGYSFVIELCEEVDILRRLLKQSLKSEHVPIVGSNEFHRNTASIAHKIGCDVESVRAIVQPILEQLVAEMFAPIPKNDKRRKRHRRNRATVALGEIRMELVRDEDMR
ncbi:MAG: hypothetical protein G01um101448_439 [Parcubacteria group bacterium Gr01-1014_48]|nr:MAG: hypothetical protein Greene041614_417 [Parcubacteria group bacterium Greene0416_14]TSC73946.1 MAG: hypothetical protein G01um101448_439 [Parcubacteria group bacterium Gr01-1014_48]TSD00937.1 MAG: hypothetical protein Greene101415_587 [Parcubacteria group bacterium Greene1014_15]TSD07889.1 MAG: hypothetical protein Greene07144_615 [Parcubacteria group bacterium Greene0714_4]